MTPLRNIIYLTGLLALYAILAIPAILIRTACDLYLNTLDYLDLCRENWNDED